MPGGLHQGAGKPNRVPGEGNQQAQRASDDTSTKLQPSTKATSIKPNVHAKATGNTGQGASHTSQTQVGQRAVTSSRSVDGQGKSKGHTHAMAKQELQDPKRNDAGTSSGDGGLTDGNRVYELNDSNMGGPTIPSTPLPGSYVFSSASTPFEASPTRVNKGKSPVNVMGSQSVVKNLNSTVAQFPVTNEVILNHLINVELRIMTQNANMVKLVNEQTRKIACIEERVIEIDENLMNTFDYMSKSREINLEMKNLVEKNHNLGVEEKVDSLGESVEI